MVSTKETNGISSTQHQPFPGLANFDVFRFFHFYKDGVVNADGVIKQVGVFNCKVSVTEDVWHDTAGNRSKTIPLFKGTKDLNALFVNTTQYSKNGLTIALVFPLQILTPALIMPRFGMCALLSPPMKYQNNQHLQYGNFKRV